jgi:hypothetical protein
MENHKTEKDSSEFLEETAITPISSVAEDKKATKKTYLKPTLRVIVIP